MILLTYVNLLNQPLSFQQFFSNYSGFPFVKGVLLKVCVTI